MKERLMRARPLLLTLVLAVLVTACGVRGNLEPPSAARETEGAPEQTAPATEDRDFILDGLLL